MKEKDANCLIIDLRNSGGGWTPITRPTLALLYGEEYYRKDFGIKSIRKLSEVYIGKFNQTIDEFNKAQGTDLKLGDYHVVSEYEEGDLPTLRSRILHMSMSETPDLLESLDGLPLYRPRQIFVITDANTTGGAFHYAFYLWKMGATLVGVASSQAPNAFLEVTRFRLPYTGLGASASNTMRLFFQDPESPYADVLTPDVEITSSDYYKYGLDANTPVLKILELCKTPK